MGLVQIRPNRKRALRKGLVRVQLLTLGSLGTWLLRGALMRIKLLQRVPMRLGLVSKGHVSTWEVSKWQV